MSVGEYGYIANDWALGTQYSWVECLYFWPVAFLLFFSLGKFLRYEWTGRPVLWSLVALIVGGPLVKRWIDHGMLLRKLPHDYVPWLIETISPHGIAGAIAAVIPMLIMIFSFVAYCVWATANLGKEE